MPSSDHQNQEYLQTLLDSARPFLREELEKIDANLPSLIAVLCSAGAGECAHKLSNFLEHLVGTYKILKLWKAPDAVCLCGLFHSTYSNSYINLAIFDPSAGRDVVRGHVGEEAEQLIHLFCVVPRHSLIHDDLLFRYSDSELAEHLKASEISLRNAKEMGVFDEDESWRKKVNSVVPVGGVTVKHIRTGEDIVVPRRVVATFLLLTMADFSDQYHGFQDTLLENTNGRLEFSGNNFRALWPGNGKPGLWMNSISRMGALYKLIATEEEIFIDSRKKSEVGCDDHDLKLGRNEEIELVIPPVFESCTRVLDPDDQIAARDLYWECIYEMFDKSPERVEELLLGSFEKNPFVGEPHVVLGQFYLSEGRYEEAEREAERGLTLLLEWGSPWDKRFSWGGWVAWARVLLMKAKEKSWPNTAFGILNLGLVR